MWWVISFRKGFLSIPWNIKFSDISNTLIESNYEAGKVFFVAFGKLFLKIKYYDRNENIKRKVYPFRLSLQIEFQILASYMVKWCVKNALWHFSQSAFVFLYTCFLDGLEGNRGSCVILDLFKFQSTLDVRGRIRFCVMIL